MTKKTFKNSVSKIAPLAKCMAAFALIHTGAASATVISAESNAYALGVDLDVSTLVSVDVAVPQAGGTAPGSYFDVSSVVGADVSLGPSVGLAPLLQLNTAALADATILESTASSSVDGATGSQVTQSSSLITDLGLDIVNTSLEVSILPLELGTAIGISADAISSESNVTGDYASLTASGNSTITNLSIDLFGMGEIDLASLGLDIGVDGVIGTGPNTQLLDFGGIVGLDLILNEQTSTCSDGFCAMDVNALRLSFDAVDLTSFGLSLGQLGQGSLLSGDIILGQSYAEMSAIPTDVPAPATLGIFGLVIMALGFTKRKLK